MDTFIDDSTRIKFSLISDSEHLTNFRENGIKDKSLIDWASQFLTKDSTFIDIGANYGEYTALLSKKCKKCYSFETNNDIYNCLVVTMANNSIFNVNLSHKSPKETPVDSYDIKDVTLIKIFSENQLEIINGCRLTLFDNNFPFIIFRNPEEDFITYLEKIGYQVHPIRGYENYYLAGDNIFREQEESSEASVNCDYNIETLTKKNEDELTWDELNHLAYYYRAEANDNEKSYYYAIKGLGICPDEHRHLFYKELSIVSFYINKKDVGFQAAENVVLSSIAPWSCRNMTLGNQGYYMSPLPMKRKININHEMPLHYIPTSASIIENNNGYRINLRGVNYYLCPKGYGVSKHGDGIIRTINYILHTDKDLKVINSVELVDNSGVKLYPKNILGMEDVRLFGDNYFFCTYLELNEKRTPQIGWGTYDPDTGSVSRMVPLQIGDEIKCEKNWLPFIDDDNEIYFIYAVGPFQLYKLNKDTGEISFVKSRTLNDDLLDVSPVILPELAELRTINGFRGSASPIKYKDHWLFTIHQVYHSDPRKYFHRFVAMDKYFDKITYSKPFYFDKVGVEFNLSICPHEDGMLVAYSHNDSTSTIAIVDYDVIDSMLCI